jgi:hypothetical protein
MACDMYGETANSIVMPLQPWQVKEVESALMEANNGQFASDEEVEAMFRELTR